MDSRPARTAPTGAIATVEQRRLVAVATDVVQDNGNRIVNNVAIASSTVEKVPLAAYNSTANSTASDSQDVVLHSMTSIVCLHLNGPFKMIHHTM